MKIRLKKTIYGRAGAIYSDGEFLEVENLCENGVAQIRGRDGWLYGLTPREYEIFIEEKLWKGNILKPDAINQTATVPASLHALGDLYEERNKLYGDNYKKFGNVMSAMFPEGMTLRGADDFNRIGLFVQVVSKIGRYAEQFDKDGHEDSLDDLAVYSQMLAEVDRMVKEKKDD